MTRVWIPMWMVLLVAIMVAGCGSDHPTPTTAAAAAADSSTTAGATLPHPRPQAIEPSAGVQAAAAAVAGVASVGDATAHAPPLTEVKHELRELNLCGGVTNSADAAPVISSAGAGFLADPGTSQTEGELPVITADLNELGKALGVTIYGISGYRTPAHSVAVGGYANDPHTKGEAEDIGVNSLLRSSAAQISEPELARFGLYRPFDPSDDPGNTEVNHVQLIPTGGPLSLAQATSVWDPDPTCQ